MNKILIAEVRKKAKFGDNPESWFRNIFVSFDREKLKNEIEKRY